MPEGVETLFSPKGGDCSHLLSLEALSKGPAEDRRMVVAAWDFEAINSLYSRHLDVLQQLPSGKAGDHRAALASWSEKENACWLEAVRADPLLPRSLLPRGYLGQRAWRQRQRALARAARLTEQLPPTFPPRSR